MKQTKLMRFLLLMLLPLGAGHAMAQTEVVMKGIKTERQFDGDRLAEIRQYDTLGRCIFEKSAHDIGVLNIWAIEYDPSGKPKRKLTCVIYLGNVGLDVEIYKAKSIEHWSQMHGTHYSGGYNGLRENNRCSMRGFPNSLEELLQHPPLKAALDRQLYKEQEDELNQDQQIMKTTTYDSDVDIRYWETFTYDEEGHCLRALRTFNDGKDTVTTTAHWDSLGNQVWKARLWHFKTFVDTTHFEKAHYVDGRRMSCDYYEHRKLVQTNTFAYDAKGKLTQEVQHIIGKADGKVWKKIVFAYDPQGLRLSKEIIYVDDPTLGSSARWEYERWAPK